MTRTYSQLQLLLQMLEAWRMRQNSWKGGRGIETSAGCIGNLFTL